MTTNYERYFGTPERAERMSVERYMTVFTKVAMVRVLCCERIVATVEARYYGAWLEIEVDDA